MMRAARLTFAIASVVACITLKSSAVADEPAPPGDCRQCVPFIIGGTQTWLCPGGLDTGADECRINATCVEVGSCP